jgi:molybdopterin adenylyltransferase
MENPTSKQHKDKAPVSVNVAIITLSDSRTLDTDDSGKLLKQLFIEAGHKVMNHAVIPDNVEQLTEAIINSKDSVDIIITDGGTGIAPKDITIQTVKPLITKEIPAFATLFTKLSYDDIGSSALVSRAMAGIIGDTAIFCLPGSPKAVELAANFLILPEVKHIVKHIGE